MISIKKISTEETYPIRTEELRRNMDLPSQFSGDFEEDTFHLGLYYKDTLVSIVSFVHTAHKNFKGTQYQLRGMATKESFQGKGFGKLLVAKSEEILRDRNIELVWCNARVVALDFYKKLGFETIGEEFDIPQIGGHYVMFKKLV